MNSKKSKGKEDRMSPGIIKAAVEMMKSIIDLTKKTMDFADPEKHAKAVDDLHQGVSDSFGLMREIIQKDETLSADEKLERLKEIAKEEAAAKERCANGIDNHQQKAMAIVKDVFVGFLTAGLSFTPKVIRGIRDALRKDDQLPDAELEEDLAKAYNNQETSKSDKQ